MIGKRADYLTFLDSASRPLPPPLLTSTLRRPPPNFPFRVRSLLWARRQLPGRPKTWHAPTGLRPGINLHGPLAGGLGGQDSASRSAEGCVKPLEPGQACSPARPSTDRSNPPNTSTAPVRMTSLNVAPKSPLLILSCGQAAPPCPTLSASRDWLACSPKALYLSLSCS
jgi:hypothetical protein